jgi:carboxypeptidase PM20D1
MYFLLAAILILLFIIVFKTINLKPKKYDVLEKHDIKIDVNRAVENLAEAVKIKTISNADKKEFNRFLKFLEEKYPLVHSRLKCETINGYSLLYRWEGRDKSKLPALFTAHMDVVPVEEGTEKDWKYPAFSGTVSEGCVWGRGTLDIKIQVIGILEAIENLLKNGFNPEREIYIAFGHDEEIGGDDGAAYISKLLKERGIKFEYVIDEGGCITEKAIAGVEPPVAVVGVAEKGYANIMLTAAGKGGHSSMPPKHTAVGDISSAIVELEKRQMKMKIGGPVKQMLMSIGPYMKLSNRIIIANLWLFSPIFKKVFSSSGTGNALLRTTTAATMIEGSMVPNVLPQKAKAVLNFRIAPWETGKDLMEHIRNVIGENVKIEALRLEDPSKISPVDTFGFKHIENNIHKVFGDVVVSPYIVLGGTDARKYEIVCENIYRFSPYQVDDSGIKSMHGTNEKISIDNIEKVVRFYTEMIYE